MKTTLDLPDDLMREVKIRAATQGRKIKDLIAEAIRDSFASPAKRLEETPPLVISRTPEGFPYIKAIPGSKKPAATEEEIQRLIEQSLLEEDLQRAGITL